MGDFRRDNPRHPHNRIAFIQEAWANANMIGGKIPIDAARVQVMRATGVSTGTQVENYLKMMEDFHVIEWERKQYVRPLGQESALLL